MIDSLAAGTSRAQFLRRGALGGLALVAGGTVLAATSDDARAAAPGGDLGIAAVAATAELLAIDFYTRCIDAGTFGGRRGRYLKGARQNEVDHYMALATLLGDDAPRNLSFRYPSGTFATRTSAARTGIALETAFIGAYLGAVRALEDVSLKVTAATIGANEQGHFIVFTDIATKDGPVGPSFPGELSLDEALAALGPFLA